MQPSKTLLASLALSLALGTSCTTLHNDGGSASKTSTSTSTSSKTSTTQSPTSGSSSKTTQPASYSGTSKKATEASAAKAAAAAGMAVSSVALPTGDEATSALLLEKIAPRSLQAGQAFDFEILVTNLTGMALENVIVTEALSSNLEVTGSKPKMVAAEAGSARWDLGTIEAHGAKTITLTGKAKDSGSISTCANVSYNAGLCMAIPVVEPALRLVASGTPEMLLCDSAKYTYIVSNTGTGVAKDVVVKGSFPAGMTASGKAGFTKEIGDLDAGKSKNFEIVAKFAKGGAYGHTATAEAFGNLKAESAPVKTTVGEPVITLTETGPAKSFQGRKLKYQIVVTNTGDGAARNLVVENTLPKGAKFLSATMNGKARSGKIGWELGDLEPKGQKTLDFVLVPDEQGRLINMAVANADCAPRAQATVATEIVGIPAILLEVVDVEDPIAVGEDATYVIRVTNQGSADGTGIKIACTLPENVEFISATGATKMPAGAQQGLDVTFPPLARLAPQAEASWTIVVRGKQVADARFRVQMTSDQLTSPVDETEATNYYQ